MPYCTFQLKTNLTYVVYADGEKNERGGTTF